MKTTLRKRLSYLLLSLLGFASACDREPVEMYGVPRADTRTQGRVTDKSGNPIPGIQVRSNGAPSKAVRTMADGSYDIADDRHPERHGSPLRTRTVRKTAASSPKRASR